MKKNLVVVGYGGMGGWHVEHALKSDVVNLLGIYDIDPAKIEKAKNKNIFAYDSLEAVLADERVDLITVAIPNDSHRTVVEACLNAKKHVICEKPVALSVEDLEAMIDTANKNGVLFTTHQNRRWDVDFLAMKQIADSKEIGEVVRVESRIHGSRGIPSDWRGKKEHGGGMILDWGIHLIDQILRIFTAKIDSLYCETTHYTNSEVDDGFRLSLYFEDGKTAYIEVGTFNFISMPRFYMQAKSGSAMITDWREKCKVVKCKAWHENDVLPVKTAAGLTKTMAPRDEVTTDVYEIERPASDVHDFYRNMVKAMNGEEVQLVTHEHMLDDMKVMEHAFLSAKLKQVVKFKY